MTRCDLYTLLDLRVAFSPCQLQYKGQGSLLDTVLLDCPGNKHDQPAAWGLKSSFHSQRCLKNRDKLTWSDGLCSFLHQLLHLPVVSTAGTSQGSASLMPAENRLRSRWPPGCTTAVMPTLYSAPAHNGRTKRLLRDPIRSNPMSKVFVWQVCPNPTAHG